MKPPAAVRILYTNYRGETSLRTIIPGRIVREGRWTQFVIWMARYTWRDSPARPPTSFRAWQGLSVRRPPLDPGHAN
jgi:hypothetical protein